MIYLYDFIFPDENQECEFIYPKDKSATEIINGIERDYRARNYNGSLYPFRVLTKNSLNVVQFQEVTLFCGGNGSGKTTALNVIAEKLGIKRENIYNSGRFFQDYLNMCDFNVARYNIDSDNYARFIKNQSTNIYVPADSRIIVSDDVFAHSMKQRKINDHIDSQRVTAENDYKVLVNSYHNIRSLDDYNRWNARNEALKSKSGFMKQYLGEEAPEHSNGETAMLYFLDRMENAGLYLLDEPENSLSLENQKILAEYIEASAHYFNCQFIIATHSPIFLSIKKARVYDFDENPVKVKNWTEVEDVKTMYHFFKTYEGEFAQE